MSPRDDLQAVWSAIMAEGGGILRVEVFRPRDVPGHELVELLRPATLEWVARMPRERPRCLACESVWHARCDELPVAFVLCCAGGIATPSCSLISGLCRRCIERPDMESHIWRAIGKRYPTAQKLSRPVPGPQRLQ